MAGEITYTQAMLDQLVAAYAQGAQTVEYEGHGRITYRSRAEMKDLIDEISRKLKGAAARRQRFALATFGRR